jgi:hypothetical protein
VTASWGGGSLGDVRAELAAIADQTAGAVQHVELAKARIAAAIEVLAGLGEHHSEPLVPTELRRAAEEVDQLLALLNSALLAVADIGTRM